MARKRLIGTGYPVPLSPQEPPKGRPVSSSVCSRPDRVGYTRRVTLTIRPAVATDAAAIADIYNQGIAERGATFETARRTAADIEARLREQARYPLLVAEEGDRVIGWAGTSSYRPRACYAGIAEVSVYLDRAARGQGVGRRLLEGLIAAAREGGFWKLVSRIFPFNTASRALCRSCGFREVGIYEKHGRLDGRWLDVVIVERLIPENQGPRSTNDDSGGAKD
jgi:L-amino acid N-acyltransferase YncA